MKQLLSPKQVATSIGVSESSLKRWCDQGLLTTEKTPGGHRRIRVAEVIRFLRDRDQEIVRPDVLGLPPGMGRSPRSVDRALEGLIAGLEEGDAEACRRIVLEVYLSGTSVVRVCDALIAQAMHAVGSGWECGRLEIYQEHRASEILHGTLYELRSLLPPPDPNAPTAVGGTPPGDNYRLPSLAVELVLIEAGWRTVSLGCSLPFITMAAAAQSHQPDLFWLSLSHVGAMKNLPGDFADFLEALPEQTRVVIGGQQLEAASIADDPRIVRCGDLAELNAFLNDFRPTIERDG